MANIDIRPSPIAGTWYSGHPDELREEVRGYINQAEVPELPGEVAAIMAPHAGYVYSGPTAGYAFRCVLGQSYDLVAVISPFHQFQRYPLLTSAHEAYETPLGVVPIDIEALESLSDYLGEATDMPLMSLSKDPEHSLEIELPFLQVALEGDFKLVPVMLSGVDLGTGKALGAGLAEILKGRKALLVASTDLSHFHAEEAAKRLDEEMLKQVAALSPEGMAAAMQCGKGEACGIMAVIAVMEAAKALGATRAEVLHHSTSGKSSGDYGRVVGYGAAVFLKG
ncbi:MAG: AmmeMemoRadiSam system protein B [Anaerolineales bacterium]|jgi:AmmeMemoRadiSam system protein B